MSTSSASCRPILTANVIDAGTLAKTPPQEILNLRAIAQTAGRLRGRKALDISVPWRWATTGLSGVVLPTACIGGSMVTTRRALMQFFVDVAEARRAQREGRKPEPSPDGERDRETLVAAGIVDVRPQLVPRRRGPTKGRS
jgi:hypothetical protein